MKMQKFISQPSDELNGYYVVAKYDCLKEQYFPIKGEKFLTEDESIERASQLNRDYCEANLENEN